MFYKIISLGLVLLGFLHILIGVGLSTEITQKILEYGAVGFCSILIGFLNFVYIYETPDSTIGKYILLGSNILFIGFSIAMITHNIDVIHAYLSGSLALICSILVLNRKV